MAFPPAAPRTSGALTPRPLLPLACLVLALVLPLGLALFVLRYMVESRPTLQPVPPVLNLILEGGATLVILLGIPASGLAIGLGHVALGRAGKTASEQRARRMARTGLALGYLALVAVLAGAGFIAFWLGTHRIHLVW
jgi:Na+/proline symporter